MKRINIKPPQIIPKENGRGGNTSKLQTLRPKPEKDSTRQENYRPITPDEY